MIAGTNIYLYGAAYEGEQADPEFFRIDNANVYAARMAQADPNRDVQVIEFTYVLEDSELIDTIPKEGGEEE